VPILKGAQLRRRRQRIENLRLGVQLLSLAVIVWIGAQFTHWVLSMEKGIPAGSRPPGVEGFLPISALISLRHLFETGQASRVHPAGLVILVLIAANALLLKRSFCSWICPVGTISESLAGMGSSLWRRRIKLPRFLDYPLRSIKYLLLAFFLHAVFIKMTPPEIATFLNSPYNKVADIKMLHFFLHPSTLTLQVLGVLLLLSFVVPYFWCRYLCPYGALLGGLSLLSPLKIRRDATACIDCGLCARACPANLKVDRLRRVDSDECIGCVSCVASCPVPAALQMSAPAPSWFRSRRAAGAPSGRRPSDDGRPWPWSGRVACSPHRVVRPIVFGALVVLLFFGGIGVAKLAGHWQTEITEAEYQRRIPEVESPKYGHARGQVPEYSAGD